MHVLVSNHAMEIAAFQRAVGPLAEQVRIVENNLSVLSLLASDLPTLRSLVITEHQDEGINVDTQTFVRNLANRILDSVEIIVVGQLFAHLDSPSIHTVATIDEAAAYVCRMEQLQPVTTNDQQAGNGHASFTLDSTTVEVENSRSDTATSAPAVSQVNEHELVIDVRQPGTTTHGSGFERETIADAGSSVAAERSAGRYESRTERYESRAEQGDVPDTTRSLADDIRDWTERNEQQRGQHGTIHGPSIWQRIQEMMPAQRRARAEESELDHRIRAPRLTRCHSIAVISPKGGVGKSFLTYLIGNFLAEVRGDKVVAIDTNPDFGTLADQVRGREEQTVSTLLDQIGSIKHYSDLRRFTSKVESRLEVLAAPADPDVMATISARDYGLVHEQLLHYYDTVLFDCGTGFRDDITRFALQQCDQIVLVSAPLFITTGIVIRALGYLSQIGCDLSRVTLAINQVRSEKPLDIEYMRSRFGHRLNAIVEIPFDLQLYHATDRGEFSVDQTQQLTRTSIKRLVAELTKHFD